MLKMNSKKERKFAIYTLCCQDTFPIVKFGFCTFYQENIQHFTSKQYNNHKKTTKHYKSICFIKPTPYEGPITT